MEKTSLHFEEPVNITNLEKGVYLYKITFNQDLYTGKIIIE